MTVTMTNTASVGHAILRGFNACCTAAKEHVVSDVQQLIQALKYRSLLLVFTTARLSATWLCCPGAKQLSKRRSSQQSEEPVVSDHCCREGLARGSVEAALFSTVSGLRSRWWHNHSDSEQIKQVAAGVACSGLLVARTCLMPLSTVPDPPLSSRTLLSVFPAEADLVMMSLPADDQGHLLLRLVLLHSDVVANQQQLCALFQTSRIVAPAVTNDCIHGLHVDFRPTSIDQASQMAAWTKHYVKLIGSMELHPCCSTDDADQQVGSAVAAALQQAGNDLQLKSFACWRDAACDELAAALAATTSKHLTHLALYITEESGLAAGEISLAPFSNVMSLEFSTEEEFHLPIVEQLTALTKLVLHGFGYVEDRLPGSLVRLDCCYPFALHSPEPFVSHLTALTQLQLTPVDLLTPRDYVPPHVRSLCGGDMIDLEALQHVTSLQQCEPAVLASPEGLIALKGRLQGLTSMSIAPVGWDTVAATVQACSTLTPIVHGMCLNSDIHAHLMPYVTGLHHITQLSNLQRLGLCDLHMSSHDLCSSLLGLPGLTRLNVRKLTVCEAGAAVDKPGTLAVAQAIGNLPSLKVLIMDTWSGASSEVWHALCAATGLTYLWLAACSVSNDYLAALCSSLTQIVELHLWAMKGLSVEVMHSMLNLQQLTVLQIEDVEGWRRSDQYWLQARLPSLKRLIHYCDIIVIDD